MNIREYIGFAAMLMGAVTISLVSCTHEPVQPAAPAAAPATVLILGNKTQPVHCSCEDETRAAQQQTVKWKAYAEKLEQQLGLPATASSDGGTP